MTPELWEKITDLYHEASELDGREQRQFIELACGDDDEVRREVESLLAADAVAGDFISTPAVGSIESWSGQFVAHYQIMSRIGSGGMGEVYLARDTKLGRPVALKTLPRPMSDRPEYIARLEDEARAAAAMNHPNVAVVYAVEEAGRHKFITMEYVEGKTLDAFIRPDGVDLKTFFEWFIPITDAIAHAHERGIAHRDIKPGNVMITKNRVPKVLDFGLAQSVEPPAAAGGRSSGNGEEVMGTPAYMSPEQADGKNVDSRTDIFSLGVLMYEALVGERPFPGGNVAAIRQSMDREPLHISRLKRNIPPRLSDLVHRCIKVAPEERPDSVGSVRDSLESISTAKSGATTDGFSAVVQLPPAKRQPRLLWLAGVVMAAALGLLVYKLIPAERETPAFGSMAQRRLSQTNDVLFAHILPDGNSFVYSTNEPRDERALWVRRITDNSVRQLVPPGQVSFWGGFTASRDGGHAYYISADRDARQGTLFRVSTFAGTPQVIAESVNDLGGISPDGERVLYVRYGPNVQLLSANAADGSDERVVKQAEANEIIRDPQFASDGRAIYLIKLARVDGVEFWSLEQVDLNGNRLRVVLEPRRTRISEIAVLKDGRGLLINAVEPVSNLTQISHVSLTDGVETRVTNDLNTYFGLSISDDETRIVSVQRNYFKDLWAGSGQDIANYRKVTAESTVNLRAGWTADGRIVYDAVDNNRPHIRVINADGSGLRQLTSPVTSDFEPRVSPDGRYIVFTSERSGERRIWRTGIDGNDPIMLAPHEGIGGAPFFSPDGENVYFVWTKNDSKSLGVVPVNGGPVVEMPLFSENYYALSPDGKQVAYAFYNDADKRFRVAVRPLGRTEPATVFDIAPTWFLYWPSGSDGLYYRELEPGQDSNSTVAFQPLSGGESKPYLSVAPDQIFDFALAPDGKRAVLIRGRLVTDAVLLTRNP